MLEPWLIMWTLSLAIYVFCKWLTWSRSTVLNAPLWLQMAYLFAWPGMDADAFLGSTFQRRIVQSSKMEYLFAFTKLLIGIVLVWFVVGQIPDDQSQVRGWIGMVGLIFFLHFGSFHILSCIWRSVGIDAKPLMNWPILARSLSEFWALRWNTAFRDLTHKFLFRPLSRRYGPRVGLGLGFFASGLVHDLVISVPAGGGYGLPTLYFMVQGSGLIVERMKWARPLRGRVLTAVVILAPAYGLFHPPFVERVVLPFLKVIGAT